MTNDERKVGWFSIDVEKHNVAPDEDGINARMVIMAQDGRRLSLAMSTMLGESLT